MKDPNGIINHRAGTALSVCKWPWLNFCAQFAELKYSPALELPRARHMKLAMRISAEVEVDQLNLCDGSKPACSDMKKLLKPTVYAKLKKWKVNQETCQKILNLFEHLVYVVCEEADLPFLYRHHDEKQGQWEEPCELLSGSILDACYFCRPSFLMIPKAGKFRICGATCTAKPDQKVMTTAGGHAVLVFENKCQKENRCIPKEGHLGQIFGELLEMIFFNSKKGVFRPVFAVRLINHHVTFFRLDPRSKDDLKKIFYTKQLPSKELKLRCSVQDPLTMKGLSLIDKGQRREILQMMANIRKFILKF